MVLDVLSSVDLRLDSVSNEELHRFLHGLSKKPRADIWNDFVAPQDILSLLQMGGRYADAARSHFRALKVSGRSSPMSHLVDALDKTSRRWTWSTASSSGLATVCQRS